MRMGHIRNTLLRLGVLFASEFSFAQNLIPNPSFDEVKFDNCGFYPTRAKFEDAVKHWLVPTKGIPILFSSELLSNCWSFVASDIPRTGIRTASILAYGSHNRRSYLEIALTEPLQVGQRYHTK